MADDFILLGFILVLDDTAKINYTTASSSLPLGGFSPPLLMSSAGLPDVPLLGVPDLSLLSHNTFY